MFLKIKKKVNVKKIAKFLETEFKGKDFNVSTFSSLNEPANNSVCFYTNILFEVLFLSLIYFLIQFLSEKYFLEVYSW